MVTHDLRGSDPSEVTGDQSTVMSEDQKLEIAVSVVATDLEDQILQRSVATGRH